jgi:hypothetical protein
MYGAERRGVPTEVAALVRLVQEADCLSFGLLRNPATSFHSDVDRNRSVEMSLHPLAASERILPTDRLAEQLIGVDNEARAAAAVINVAYSR